jgi:hypothetical protein
MEYTNYMPLDVQGQNYHIHLCDDKDAEVLVGFREEKRPYELPNDSTGYGYTADIYYHDNKNYSLVKHLEVGTGSEFEVGNCRFRVIKVFGPVVERIINPKDTTQSILLFNKLAIQQLTAPKRCICANRQLKAYDEKGLDADWVVKLYEQYWRQNK